MTGKPPGKLHLTKDGDTSEIGPDEEIGAVVSMISAEQDDPATIKRSARAFVKLATKYPTAELRFTLHGFADETRSLAEVPEALQLVLRWATEVRKLDPKPLARLGRTSHLMLMVAEGRARYVRIDATRGHVIPNEESNSVH